MYFSKVVAMTVLTFTASALAAPTTTGFDIAAPIEAREAEVYRTSFDVVVRDADVNVKVEAREAGLNLEARGFGCGVFSSRYECNDHVSRLAAMYRIEIGVADVLSSARVLGAGALVVIVAVSCTIPAFASLGRPRYSKCGHSTVVAMICGVSRIVGRLGLVGRRFRALDVPHSLFSFLDTAASLIR
jgi:hypothetical protein